MSCCNVPGYDTPSIISPPLNYREISLFSLIKTPKHPPITHKFAMNSLHIIYNYGEKNGKCPAKGMSFVSYM